MHFSQTLLTRFPSPSSIQSACSWWSFEHKELVHSISPAHFSKSLNNLRQQQTPTSLSRQVVFWTSHTSGLAAGRRSTEEFAAHTSRLRRVAAAQHRRTALPPRYTISTHCGTLFALLIGILPLAYCYGHPLTLIIGMHASSAFSFWLVTISPLHPCSSTTIVLCGLLVQLIFDHI